MYGHPIVIRQYVFEFRFLIDLDITHDLFQSRSLRPSQLSFGFFTKFGQVIYDIIFFQSEDAPRSTGFMGDSLEG